MGFDSSIPIGKLADPRTLTHCVDGGNSGRCSIYLRVRVYYNIIRRARKVITRYKISYIVPGTAIDESLDFVIRSIIIIIIMYIVILLSSWNLGGRLNGHRIAIKHVR